MKSNFLLIFRSLVFQKAILFVLLSTTTIVLAQGPLVRIDIQPDDFSLYPGPTIIFTATGYNADNTVIPLLDPTWTGTGGPLIPNGNICDLIATDPGTHLIICSKDGIVDTAIVRILGPLQRITITPDTAYLAIGDTVGLNAEGYDEFDNQVPLQDLTWSTTNGIITPNPGSSNIINSAKKQGTSRAPGYYLAIYMGIEPGTHTVTASVEDIDGTATMIVRAPPGQLERIETIPDSANLQVNEEQQFSAKGYDRYNIEVPITPTWAATGGTITSNGLYTAGNLPGNFSVTASDQGISQSSPVAISAGPLARIEITPTSASLKVGEQQHFSAKGYDQVNNIVPIIPTWMATGGTITQTGLYAATTAGDFSVTASDQGISGKAKVNVTQSGGQIVKIKVNPRRVILTTGGKQKFRATGYDRYGRPVPFNPIWRATRGTITQDGFYTAGSRPGVGLVNAQAPGTHVRGYAWVIIRPKIIKKIVVTPNKVNLTPGQIQQFTAKGYDISGQPLDVPFTWSATGGNITQQGRYTAGSRTGIFRATVRSKNSPVFGLARVKIASNLHRIELKPASVTLKPGVNQQFTATGYDINGASVPFTTIWTATGGKITQNGSYTAGSRQGTFMVTVRAKGTWIWARAHGTIYQRLTRIVVKPKFSILKREQSRQFSAKGYDRNGREVSFSAIWSTNGGAVTQQGMYTAPSKREYNVITVKDRASALSGHAVVWVR
jgi:hypothetical protein